MTEPIPRPRTGGRAGMSATVSQAVDALTGCRRIFVAGGCGAPTAMADALVAGRDRWDRLELVADYLLAPLSVFDHPGDPFHLISLQPSRAVDRMRDAGALGTVSSSLRHFPKLTRPDGPLPVDAAVLQVSQPGPDGRFSLGVSVGTPVEIMANAPFVIAEVNQQMPYTFGAGELDRDEIDLLVETDHPLVELPASAVDHTTSRIGALVAEEVPDGSIIQFGVGAIPKAVLDALHDHQNLGVHGGMIGDEVVALHGSGAINGITRPTWPGKMVVGAVLGSRVAFDFADRNPDLLMVPSTISHGPVALGALDRFVAINSAVEVALDGSINAEMAGHRVLSGPGGQPDYLVGAAEAENGRSIIALPSTAGRDGSRSRIVPAFDTGTSVTGLRSLADLVITEHGVARLKGRTFAQRADALRAVADPAHRAGLSGRP